MKLVSRFSTFTGLLLLTASALFIHGYHLGYEDQVVHLPGIKISLNPSLYPHDREFILAHAQLMVFPQMVASTARWSHLPLDWAIFLWHLLTLWLTLWACLRLSRRIFHSPEAQWAAVAMVTALLTMPVTATALYLMDQYLHPRSLATALLLFMLADVLDRKLARAFLLLALAAVVHIQMAFYGALLAIFFLLPQSWFKLRRESRIQAPMMACAVFFFPLSSMFQPASPAWREAVRTRWFLYLDQWPWYGWLGIFAPLVLLAWYGRIGLRHKMPVLRDVAPRLSAFGLFIFASTVVLTVPPALERLTPYQPMRGFHLIYLFFVLLTGGLLGGFVLRRKVWRWAVLFLPLCLTMFYVQRQLLPASTHVEWPGQQQRNRWLEAFAWIQQNAPVDAYFALDPEYLLKAGEDVHGFRGLAERSMMADYSKDASVALMFPAVAGEWQRQVRAREGWASFHKADLERLHREYGVDWVVLMDSQAAAHELSCPYQNQGLQVCQVP